MQIIQAEFARFHALFYEKYQDAINTAVQVAYSTLPQGVLYAFITLQRLKNIN